MAALMAAAIVLLRPPGAGAAESTVIAVDADSIAVALPDAGAPSVGSPVQVFFDAGGVRVKVGDWRVSRVTDTRIEATPVAVEAAPAPGMIAVFQESSGADSTGAGSVGQDDAVAATPDSVGRSGPLGTWLGMVEDHGHIVFVRLTVTGASPDLGGEMTILPDGDDSVRESLRNVRWSGQELSFLLAISGAIDDDTLAFTLALEGDTLVGHATELDNEGERVSMRLVRYD